MTSHRVILKKLLKAQGLTLPEIARRMGWKSPRAVAHKLKGSRDWATGELQKMCKIAGITLVQLAAQADDIFLTKTGEALELARIADDLSAEDRRELLERAKRLQAERKIKPPGK